MNKRITVPLLLLVAASPVLAQEPSWDKVANIRHSAAEIGSIQKERGFLAAQESVRSCYNDARQPGRTYGKDVERCITQDYVISRAAAGVYTSVSAEARRLANAPEPAAVLQGMSQRIVESMAHFRVPEGDARAFIALVKEHAIEAFMGAQSPPSRTATLAEKPPGEQKECSLRVLQGGKEIAPESVGRVQRFKLDPNDFRVEVDPISCSPSIALTTEHQLAYITQTPLIFTSGGVFAAGTTDNADILGEIGSRNPRTSVDEVIEYETRDVDWARREYQALCSSLSYCPTPVIAYSTAWPFRDPATRKSRGYAEFKRFDRFNNSMSKASGRVILAIVYTQSNSVVRGKHTAFYVLRPHAIALDFR